MSQKTPFLPFGSVSSQPEFEPFHTHRKVLPEPLRKLLDLLQPTEDFDLGEDLFFLAWELLSFESLQPHDLRATMLLILASLINLRQGSTCLPLWNTQDQPTQDLPRLLDIILQPLQDPSWDQESIHQQILTLLKNQSLPTLIGNPGDFKPFILENGSLYHQRMLHYEDLLVEALLARFQRQKPSLVLTDAREHFQQVLSIMPQFEPDNPYTLTSHQQFAVLTALHHPWSIITGGPGTGKTSIIVTLLRMLHRLQIHNVLLAAPTGKAANRMQESLQKHLSLIQERDPHAQNLLEALPPTQTLHRLLGYSKHHNLFHHHEYNLLDAQIVIIDEASMIDMFMMAQLVRSVSHNTHIVLLGDAEQLPSVDSGAILRDLLPDSFHTDTPYANWIHPPLERTYSPANAGLVRLHTSHRVRSDDPQGRQILHVAKRVRSGDVDEMFGSSPEQIAPLEDLNSFGFSSVSMLSTNTHNTPLVEHLRSFVRIWSEKMYALQQLPSNVLSPLQLHDGESFQGDDLEHVKLLWNNVHSSKVLCLTRVFETGTNAINELFLTHFRTALGAHSTEMFFPGVPVMMSRNDYERELFNGDQGVIVSVQLDQTPDAKPILMVAFPKKDTFFAYTLEQIQSRLRVSFAMTVHKSQGSEFQHTALILPPRWLPLLTREVLYTGITRSKRSVLLMGEPQILQEGIRSEMKRYSRLPQKLKQRR